MNEESWKEFWSYLLEDGKKIKLPMVGSPTLDKLLERKLRQWKEFRVGH